MKVLIADGHWISRAGLAHLLGAMFPGLEVVEASTFAEAGDALRRERGIDLCLVDVCMPDMDPLDGLRHIVEIGRDVPVVVETLLESRQLVLKTVELGAAGYLLKSYSADEIRRCIKRVLAGEIALPASLRDMPPEAPPGLSDGLTRFLHQDTASPLSLLTPRQRQVLAEISHGKRNAQIAAELHISPRTVQIHVSTILKLLKVGNRTEAALLARRYDAGTPE